MEGIRKPKKDPEDDAKERLSGLYKRIQNPAERIEELTTSIRSWTEYLVSNKYFTKEEIEEMCQKLKSLSAKTAGDENSFVLDVSEIIKPFFAMMEDHAAEFEEFRAKVNNEKQGYIELNRLVTYEKDGDEIWLHHSEGRTVVLRPTIYKEAMIKLAEIVAGDPEVKTINARSWIVAKWPNLFTLNGFTVKKEPELSNEGREEAQAIISREDFLKRFGSGQEKI